MGMGNRKNVWKIRVGGIGFLVCRWRFSGIFCCVCSRPLLNCSACSILPSRIWTFSTGHNVSSCISSSLPPSTPQHQPQNTPTQPPALDSLHYVLSLSDFKPDFKAPFPNREKRGENKRKRYNRQAVGQMRAYHRKAVYKRGVFGRNDGSSWIYIIE